MTDLALQIRIAIAAARNWCDYLEENDREDEIPPIEEAVDRLQALLGNREGRCFRCGTAVTETMSVIYVDAADRDDCPESADGLPHEIDEPS